MYMRTGKTRICIVCPSSSETRRAVWACLDGERRLNARSLEAPPCQAELIRYKDLNPLRESLITYIIIAIQPHSKNAKTSSSVTYSPLDWLS